VKRIGIVLGVVLILAFLVAVLAPFFIDLNRYKDTILSQLEPYVPRDVDLQRIELTVLSGLGAELHGLRVGDNPAFSTGDFLKLESLQVRVRVLPLFKRQIKVKRIILKKPVVRLARDAAGEFSFNDLRTSGEKSAADEEDEPTEDMSVHDGVGGGGGMLAGLLVNELVIQQGTIVYQDEMLWPGAKPLVIDDLDVDMRDLSFDRPISIRLAANWMGGSAQNVLFTGELGPVGEEVRPDTVPLSIRTSLREIPIEGFLSRLSSELPLGVESGTVSLDWEADGSLADRIASKAKVDFQGLRFEPSDPAPGEPEPSALDCSITEELVLEFAAEKLLLKSLDVSVNGEQLQMKGTVESFRTDPRWDVEIWSEGFRPEPLMAILPMAANAMPTELDFEGPFTIRAKTVGTQEEFQVDLHLDMEGMEILYPERFQKPSGTKFSIGCKADKKGERITLDDLGLRLHTLSLNVSGELALLETPHFGFLLQTSPTALEGWDALCPLLSSYQPKGSFLLRSSLRGTPDDASVKLQVSSDKVTFQLPPPEGAKGDGADRAGLLESCNLEVQAKRKAEKLHGLAQAEIKKGQVLNVPFERLLSSVRFSPDGLEIEGLEMKAFQGHVQGTGRYDLARGTWSFKPRVKDVAMGEVLNRLTEYKNLFSGTFRGQFEANGSSQDGAEAVVNAEGSFRISEGELKNFDMTGGVLDSLFGLEGVNRKLSSSEGEVREHKTTRFDWLEGAFELRQRILFLNSLRLRNISTSKATDSDAHLEGKVILGEQSVDMKGKVILSKRHSDELVGQTEILKALYNPEKRIVLPFRVKGDAKKMVTFLDTKYVTGAISKYYARQGVEKLREQLGLPEKSEDGEAGPAQRLLRELFQKRQEATRKP
jgi:hypothetical protein